ncbi:hypothetical protein A6R68_11610, partial [Neotoma lepida]
HEIDQDVAKVSKKFLPVMAIGYSSSKLTLHVGDGFEFMKQNQNAFNIIITDFSDLMGPAERPFKASYYQLMETALREDSILGRQGKCQWLHLDLIKEIRQISDPSKPCVAAADTGPEPNNYRSMHGRAVNGSQLGKDYIQLKRLLQPIRIYSRASLYGPNIGRPRKNVIALLDGFMKVAGSTVDAVTWQ